MAVGECDYFGNVKQNGPLGPESLSYQKKDGAALPCPPFLWYDTEI